MKTVLAFALVAACVAASYSAPVPEAVNWPAVRTKIQEIESSVRSAVQQIKAIAVRDNEQVGGSISDQLDDAAVDALAALQEALDGVNDQSLTEAHARELLEGLKVLLLKLQDDLKDELAQLSSEAAGQISQIFNYAYEAAEQKAQELYDLLAAFAPQAVDWRAVTSKVGEIEALVRDAVQEVKTIANNDNEQVGSSIADQLDKAAVKATEFLNQAAAAIRDQTLTEAQAKDILDQLKALLAGIKQDLQDELAQLSAAAAQQIRDKFDATYASAEDRAQELYALLRQ